MFYERQKVIQVWNEMSKRCCFMEFCHNNLSKIKGLIIYLFLSHFLYLVVMCESFEHTQSTMTSSTYVFSVWKIPQTLLKWHVKSLHLKSILFHNYFPCHEHRVYPVIHAALWYKHSHDTMQFAFPCQCLTAVGCCNYQHMSCSCSITGLEETTNTVISLRVSIYRRIMLLTKTINVVVPWYNEWMNGIFK